MSPDTTRSSGDEGGAQQMAQQAAGRVQEAVGDAADTAMDTAKRQLDQRSTQAAEQAQVTGDALRTTSDQLRQQGNQAVAEMADQAAKQAQRLGSYLEQADADQMLADVERYARRNPWAVVLGGMLVGAAAARFVKASSTDRYRQRQLPASTSRPGSGLPVDRPRAVPTGAGTGYAGRTADYGAAPATGRTTGSGSVPGSGGVRTGSV